MGTHTDAPVISRRLLSAVKLRDRDGPPTGEEHTFQWKIYISYLFNHLVATVNTSWHCEFQQLVVEITAAGKDIVRVYYDKYIFRDGD